MWIDKQQMFSEAQAITATGASTNVIDMGLGDAGKSQPESLNILVTIPEAFNNLTSLAIKLQTAVDAAFSSPVDLPVQATCPLASLTLNSIQLQAGLPIGCLRYLRLYYTVAGTAPTTGRVTAGLILERQTNP